MTEKRKISAKKFRLIASELQALEKKGLDASVVTQIREMYDPPQEDPHRWEKRILFTLCSLAVLWLGLSLFLIISHNWNLIPPLVKLFSAFILWGLSWGSLLTFRKRSPIVSELLVFLTSVLYGVVLWQVAQVFHFKIGYSAGFWFWGVGVWLVSLNAQSLLLPTLSGALLAFWSLMTAGTACGGAAPFPILSDYLYRFQFPNLYLTLLVVSVGGWFYFRRRSLFAAQICYYLLFFWILPILIQFNQEEYWPWFLIIWSGGWLAVRYFIARKPLFSLEAMVLAFSLLIVSVYDYHTYVMLWSPYQSIQATCLASGLVIFLAVALIRTRGRWGGRSYFAGISLLLIWGIVEYIDLFGKRGYLSSALVFFFLALVFFVTATVWYRLTKSKNKGGQEEISDDETPRPWHFFAASQYSGWILLVAILFQGGAFCYQIIPMVWGFRHAKEITVRARPVDPRSFLRGDYVRFNYDFSVLEESRYDSEQEKVVQENRGTPIDPDWNGNWSEKKGRVIFIALKPNEWGEYEINRWSFYPIVDLNENEVVLRGRLTSYARVDYGIETYFVPEGEGKEIEQAMRRVDPDNPTRQSRVRVVLLVNPHGRARIKDVMILPPEDTPAADAENEINLNLEDQSSGEAIQSAADSL